MPYFDSSYGRVAYTDTQSGRATLIFMHGLPTAKELFGPLARYLEPAYRRVAFDLNDYGQSAKIGRPISHRQRADVLDELRAHLNLERFHLVAHDLGASVAIDYMGQYGRHVQTLVLMSPPVYPYFREPFIVRLTRTPGLGELLVRLLGDSLFRVGIARGMVHRERLTPELLRAFSGPFHGPEGRAALLRVLRWGHPHIAFQHYPHIIRSIDVPTLILQGRHDPYILHTQVFRLHEDVRDSKLIVIEDAAHFLPIDAPRRVAQAINAFLALEAA